MLVVINCYQHSLSPFMVLYVHIHCLLSWCFMSTFTVSFHGALCPHSLSPFMVLYVHIHCLLSWCFMSTFTVSFHGALCPHSLSPFMVLYVHIHCLLSWCFMSTEAIKLIMDGEREGLGRNESSLKHYNLQKD